MTYTITFHPKAMEEYRDASIWYELQQNGLGIRFEEVVEDKITQIINNPSVFSIIKGPYRQAKTEIFPFVIVYKLNERKREVYVSSIFHTKRNPREKFRTL